MPSTRSTADMPVTSWGGRALGKASTPVPKIIWSYWDDETPPKSVMAAQKSWAIHAPGYEIRMLSKHTAAAMTGRIPLQVRRRRPAAISDWIRLKVLAEYGGVWLDASLILLQPIDAVLPPPAIQAGQPFMFFNRDWSTDPVSPMLETWLISAPKNSEYIKKLSREYSLACISRGNYIRLMNRIFKTKILQGYPKLRYFTCFAAIQAVLLRNKGFSVAMADSELGPYKLSKHVGYQSELIANALLSDALADIAAVKLTHHSRDCLDALLEIRSPDPGSALAAYL